MRKVFRYPPVVKPSQENNKYLSSEEGISPLLNLRRNESLNSYGTDKELSKPYGSIMNNENVGFLSEDISPGLQAPASRMNNNTAM